MIGAEECDLVIGFAPDELRRARAHEIARTRVRTRILEPRCGFTRIGAPVDIRSGEEVRWLAMQIHDDDSRGSPAFYQRVRDRSEGEVSDHRAASGFGIGRPAGTGAAAD